MVSLDDVVGEGAAGKGQYRGKFELLAFGLRPLSPACIQSARSVTASAQHRRNAVAVMR